MEDDRHTEQRPPHIGDRVLPCERRQRRQSTRQARRPSSFRSRGTSQSEDPILQAVRTISHRLQLACGVHKLGSRGTAVFVDESAEAVSAVDACRCLMPVSPVLEFSNPTPCRRNRNHPEGARRNLARGGRPSSRTRFRSRGTRRRAHRRTRPVFVASEALARRSCGSRACAVHACPGSACCALARAAARDGNRSSRSTVSA